MYSRSAGLDLLSDNMTTDTFSKIDADQIAEDLHTILDLVRWSVSCFNQAELFYGHGTDNPWDEAVSLILQLLHLHQDLVLQTGEQLFHSRLTKAEKLKIIKDKLVNNLPTAPLYDTPLFTQQLESAYSIMYERYQKGLDPDYIYVKI